MNTTETYTCRLDVQGWQLYKQPGAKRAADVISRNLTEKVRKAREMMTVEPLLSAHKLAEKIRDEMYTVMGRYRKHGAWDTEPSCVLVTELEKAFGLRTYSLDR